MCQGKVDHDKLENHVHISNINNNRISKGIIKKLKKGICSNKIIKKDTGINIDIIGIKTMLEIMDIGIIILKVCAKIKKLPQNAA